MRKSVFKSWMLAVSSVIVASTTPILAREVKVPEVPGDDIFGFTSPTDVGKTGDSGFVNENDGRVGKRQGSYIALDARYEFSRTVADNWWMAGSLFASYNHSQDVPRIDNIDRLAFDGLSFEIEHRILERSASNPFAISLAIEPRWGHIDGITGQISNSLGAAFKVFADAVVVPDKVYWGANLIYAPQGAQNIDNRSQWLGSSITLISIAFTYQASAKFFLGIEGRYLSDFDTAWPTHNIGNAFYLGPTMLWKLTDKVAFNVTYQPQVAGRSSADPRYLDLDNFERAQFRAKLAITFN